MFVCVCVLRNERIKWCVEGISHYNGSVTGGWGGGGVVVIVLVGGGGGLKMEIRRHKEGKSAMVGAEQI